MNLPLRRFRRSPVRTRRKMLKALILPENKSDHRDFDLSGNDGSLLDLADAMVEQAVGYMGIPLGIAGPFVIDGKQTMIPMATEEPSVIAAASYAGNILSKYGGLKTESKDPIMTAQLFIENTDQGEAAARKIEDSENIIKEHLSDILSSMEKRGGGWRELETRWIEVSETLVINFKIDVRDAMGANLLNSAAEKLRPLVESITGGQVLMAILSNRSLERTATAEFSLPVEALGSNGFDGDETARRIVRAAEIARQDPDRAVTHNKGIMNGISALALVTGNDTRALEAAAHSYAGRTGPYHGLTEYRIAEGLLEGKLEMPLPFAATGGAVGFHPVSRWAMEILGNPDAGELSRIAAALGLAQNLSALRALVSEGIQKGHMSLHARRLAYDAGARGEEISSYAEHICDLGIRSRQEASSLYLQWKDKPENEESRKKG